MFFLSFFSLSYDFPSFSYGFPIFSVRRRYEGSWVNLGGMPPGGSWPPNPPSPTPVSLALPAPLPTPRKICEILNFFKAFLRHFQETLRHVKVILRKF